MGGTATFPSFLILGLVQLPPGGLGVHGGFPDVRPW